LRNKVLERIREKAETDYKKFNCGLIPGVDPAKVIGARVPEVRKVAKWLAGNDFTGYIDEVKQISPEELFFEEKMIWGMVIGYARISDDEKFRLIGEFVPVIDNWAVCDSVDSTYKFLRKDPEKGWIFIEKYLRSAREFEKRFGVVMLLTHYVNNDEINAEYMDRILAEMVRLGSGQPYYVMMAVAWNLSVCYIKAAEKTEEIFRGGRLDDETQNKAIQKIRESFRVSAESKERLSGLKRKNALRRQ